MPAETHVERGPLDRQEVFELIRDRLADILETEVTTAARVADFMFDKGLAQAERPWDTRAWIESQLYTPQY